ncbi:MAG TPA: ATP-binding SpoIIE family protein phosphatase [Chryseosolibacter sp.]
MDRLFTSYSIEDRSYISYLKREIHKEVSLGSFSEQRAGEIDIIVSEICSNTVKYATSGEVLYRTCHQGQHSTFEIIALDKGPGIPDISRMMRDGVSTGSTLGQGLGAIERLSDVFNIYSIPQWGTIVYSKVTTNKTTFVRKENLDLDVRGLMVAKPREVECGDLYRVKRTQTDVRVFLGDGLGHGKHAQEAVERAADFFFESDDTNPVDILRQMHEKVRRTRGLVGTIGIFDRRLNQWRICGVGNIVTRLYQGITYKNYMSYNGTIGLNIPTSMNVSVIPAERNQYLIMCSDGIRSRWDVTRFPSILKYDNMILASAVYKDFNRGTDDSSVLISKVS